MCRVLLLFLEKSPPSVEICLNIDRSHKDSGSIWLHVGSQQDVCADGWKFWISDLGFFMQD